VLAALVVVLALVVAEPTLAAPGPPPKDTTEIGDNLGKEVQSWGKALLFGVVALVGLPALAKRDFAQTMVITGIAVIIGGFVFATGTVETIVKSLWTTLGS
jgi:hypothetical protein